MNVRQSVLGEVAVRSGLRFAGVDVGSLVRRLILFDKVIIKSFRLRETPVLVRAFGKEGFGELIKLGLLRFSCEFTTLILDLSRNGIRHVPLEHFSFAKLEAVNREGDLRKELVALQSISGLKNRERVALEETIWGSLVRPPKTFADDLLAQLDGDLRANTPALRLAVFDRLRAKLGVHELPAEVSIEVEETAHRVFHVKNDLAASYGFSSQEVHDLLHQAVVAVANLGHRLTEMQAYSAITGFLDTEAPLLFGKFSSLVAPLNPAAAEKQFERVIELAELPDFSPGQKVDVQKLLKARDSAECREFREWLSNLDSASDAGIKEMVASLRSKMASIAASPGGKLMRLAATTGIGLIPGVGLIAGAAAGAIDSFLVDKVLPRSGIVAFLTETYPSLFVSP
ncbi:MAG: hypothetical protein ACHP9V_01900 [Terriglobales bacterium]